MAKLAIFYIVEPPKYDVLACHLIASIRQQWVDQDIELIGYAPKAAYDNLQKAVHAVHENLQAEIRPMETDGLFDPPYPHGNKIAACLQKRDSDFGMFVDSDVLFIAPTKVEDYAVDGHVSCSMAASMQWDGKSDWPKIYQALDTPIPEERYALMRHGHPQIPYFSSGLVAFPDRPLENGKRFPEIWHESALMIDKVEDIEKKRPYLDQMSLAPSIRRAGLDWNILPEELHYIMGGRILDQQLPRDQGIQAIHYRNEKVLKKGGMMEEFRRALARQTGFRFVSRIQKAIDDDPDADQVIGK